MLVTVKYYFQIRQLLIRPVKCVVDIRLSKMRHE